MGEVTQHPVAAIHASLSAPELLSDQHDLSQFDCGRTCLNDWLRHRAMKSDGKTSRTFVVHSALRVVGYYCLAAGEVAREALPSGKFRRNTPELIPVVVLGRLAVDQAYQKQGIGAGLLKDAVLRSIESSRTIGIRAVLVHALDDEAMAFYVKYGFLLSPVGEKTLLLPIETAIEAIRT